MDQIEVKLEILIDGMKKKEQALAEIVGITDNQGTVLESGLAKDEILAFIVQMNIEKQVHIETVINCDNLFEKILKEIGPELDENQHLYGKQINILQELIRRVMDMDVAVRVSEDKNKESTKKIGGLTKPGARGEAADAQRDAFKPNKKPAQVITDDSRVIKAYEQNSRNYKGTK